MGDLETKKENESLVSKFSCRLCDKTSTVKLEIANHIQDHHQEDVSSQTEEELLTEEAKPEESTSFPCFYCETLIISRSDLFIHRKSCQDKSWISLALPYPCEQCSIKCRDKHELEEHYMRYHPIPMIVLWCNICYTNFRSEAELQDHKRSIHESH